MTNEPFLEDLGATSPIEVGDIWLIAPNNNAEIAIERMGLGKEMKKMAFYHGEMENLPISSLTLFFN